MKGEIMPMPAAPEPKPVEQTDEELPMQDQQSGPGPIITPTPQAPAAVVEAAREELKRKLDKPIEVRIEEGRAKAGTLGEYWRLATLYLNAGLVPYSLSAKRSKEETLSAVVAVLMTADQLGLTHQQGLAWMIVVNNRVSLWGDAIPALIRRNSACLGISETFEGDGESLVAVCEMKRRHADGSVELIRRAFGVADARVAGLWNKKGFDGKPTPWVLYPKRMLQMRARGWAARDGFADSLLGLAIAEEELDTVNNKPQTASIIDGLTEGGTK